MAIESTANEQRTELAAQRRSVDFDTYDVTVDELLRRLSRRRIDIAPVYQRKFRWDRARQSQLIESIFLGIPIPPLFMATNRREDLQNQWEVVDGLQRLLTLAAFAGDEEVFDAAGLDLKDDRLTLFGLEKIPSFDGLAFTDLPEDIRTSFEDRPVRVVVLNDKSDLQVRFDLFERLNTGGIALTAQEIRESVYRGPFMDLLDKLANSEEFRTVVKLAPPRWKDGTPQDYVLRFFAFAEEYRSFKHLVQNFLNEFVQGAHADPQIDRRNVVFRRTFAVLARSFPEGLVGKTGQTPVNLFEGVSVGAALALRLKPELTSPVNPDWIRSDELREYISAATNSRPKVVGRVEFAEIGFCSTVISCQLQRDDLQDRLGSIRSLIDASHANTPGVPDVSREARGLAVVLLYASYENLLTSLGASLLNTASSLRVGNRRLRPGLKVFAAYRELCAIGGVAPPKIWTRGLAVVEQLDQTKTNSLNSGVVFPNDGSNFRTSQVRTFCNVFGLSDPAPVLREVWNRLDTIVADRNAVAHGRETPVRQPHFGL